MPVPNALHTVAEIREIEAAAIAALPDDSLMQRAGRAAVDLALQLIAVPPSEAEVLVLAGPGNNGGDALESAHLLAESGADVSVVHFAGRQQPADAQHAFERARRSAVKFIAPTEAILAPPARWNLVIDGLFGIGLTRPLSDTTGVLVQAVNHLACPVLALDVPSGLNADTGNIVGNGLAVNATHTITFIANKPGLHTCFGRDHAGRVQVARLEVNDSRLDSANMHLNDVDAFSRFLPRRLHNSHKGSYGDVVAVGGAAGMAGALILAARAAVKCGAGRVFAAFLDAVPAYDPVQPELMCRLARDLDLTAGTLVIGPGLGTSRLAHDLLAKALHTSASLVLDADALNLIAEEPGLEKKLIQRSAPAVITPHPLEAARLLQTTASDIQADRLAAARRLARRFNSVVVLKGSGSVIAKPDGELLINPTGGPALATAGTGDALAGICGALLAQGLPVWNAALATTWMHGRAADILAEQNGGPIGFTASELIPGVRAILNQLATEHAGRGLRSAGPQQS